MRLNKCGKMVFYIIMDENFGSEDRTKKMGELNTEKNIVGDQSTIPPLSQKIQTK